MYATHLPIFHFMPYLREGAMQRVALKPFTFSDGSSVPVGTMIACPVLSIQRDEAYHDHASEFVPWRYSTERENIGGYKNNLFHFRFDLS